MMKTWFKLKVHRRLETEREKAARTYVVYAETTRYSFETTGRLTTVLFYYPNTVIIGSVKDPNDYKEMQRLLHNYRFPLFPM